MSSNYPAYSQIYPSTTSIKLTCPPTPRVFYLYANKIERNLSAHKYFLSSPSSHNVD